MHLPTHRTGPPVSPNVTQLSNWRGELLRTPEKQLRLQIPSRLTATTRPETVGPGAQHASQLWSLRKLPLQHAAKTSHCLYRLFLPTMETASRSELRDRADLPTYGYRMRKRFSSESPNMLTGPICPPLNTERKRFSSESPNMLTCPYRR
ncbi:hypothetical protein PMIN01_06160 [Paraphaeosphaeria minitans]|uniref:Uncharacterized protein n=1 Tax=Paraphaeosphaeria minitans TaxID=565426 RepID=A0A9P6GJR0_9PLEO|nr:hypothetical protein PMIN01_06160 [Paraphaeosphaeria minitans]